jgi:hypothetical protein
MRRSDDDLLLAEAKFQILAVRMPPRVIDVAGHDLNHNDMVAFKVAIILPDAFCGALTWSVAPPNLSVSSSRTV